jgi:hypothetical protein
MTHPPKEAENLMSSPYFMTGYIASINPATYSNETKNTEELSSFLFTYYIDWEPILFQVFSSFSMFLALPVDSLVDYNGTFMDFIYID